jgi:hypothetical protein
MVYTTVRFKIEPKPSDQPISIGDETNIPSGIGTLNSLLQQLFPGYAPIQFPTPSTVSDGGIPDVVGPGGGGSTGTGMGEGQIVSVQVPSSAASGSSFLIKSTFKNVSATTQNMSLRITIPALGIDTVTPTISITPGQQSMIESTIILPNVQFGGNYPGAVELRSITSTNVILFQDSEAFTLAVVGSGTSSGGPAAAITPSASTVKPGQSISISCINFGANERVDFVAKVGTTTVSTDNKTAGATGALVLDTLTFYSSAPLGIAVITATGATTGKIATAQVTVTSTTTTGAKIVLSSSTVKRGSSISIQASGFQAGERIGFWASPTNNLSISIAGDNKNAGSDGSVRLDTLTFSSSAPLGTATVFAKGRTSMRQTTAPITVVSSSTSTSGTAKISAPSSVHDGDTFRVSGSGFKGGERVTTTVSGTWKGGSYNGRTYSRSVTVTASSSGSFAVNVGTPEVPSGVSSTATIRSKGLTSGKTASRTIAIL